MKDLEATLADVQRQDAKAQSTLDLKKKSLKDETKKKNELVKSMEEVCEPNWFCIFVYRKIHIWQKGIFLN